MNLLKLLLKNLKILKNFDKFLWEARPLWKKWLHGAMGLGLYLYFCFLAHWDVKKQPPTDHHYVCHHCRGDYMMTVSFRKSFCPCVLSQEEEQQLPWKRHTRTGQEAAAWMCAEILRVLEIPHNYWQGASSTKHTRRYRCLRKQTNKIHWDVHH